MTVFESNAKTQNCKAHSTTLDNRDLISCKFNPRWKNTKKSRGQGQQDKKDEKTIKEKQKHKEEQEQQGEKNKKNKKKSKKKKKQEEQEQQGEKNKNSKKNNKKNKNNNKERRTRRTFFVWMLHGSTKSLSGPFCQRRRGVKFNITASRYTKNKTNNSDQESTPRVCFDCKQQGEKKKNNIARRTRRRTRKHQKEKQDEQEQTEE